MQRLLLLILLSLALPQAVAASTADTIGIAIAPRPGARLPLDIELRDDDGQNIRLGNIIGGRPLVLVLGYFRCTTLCGLVRANLIEALEQAHLAAGRDFSFAALSVDSSESPQDAATIKEKELDAHPALEPRSFHFLTGAPDAVGVLADGVGFLRRPLQKGGFAHPVGVMFVSPAGILTGYLLGVSYPVSELRLALRRAAMGEVAAIPSPLRLLCYDFDVASGRYTFAILKTLRVVSAGLAVVAVLLLAFTALGERRRA